MPPKSKANPTKSCLICNSNCDAKSPREETAGKSISDAGDVSCDVDVVLLLRKILKVPTDLYLNFLTEHGSPREWGVVLCSLCQGIFLARARTISNQITALQNELEGLQGEVMSTIKIRSGQEATNGKPKTRGPKRKIDPFPVVKKVREWVLEQKDIPNKVGVAREDFQQQDKMVGLGLQMAQTENAFKSLGTGQKLCSNNNDPQPGPSSSCHSSGVAVSNRKEIGVSNSKQEIVDLTLAPPPMVSEEKRAAAAAALARFDKNRKPEANSKEMLASRQAAFIKEQAKKELEEEKLKTKDPAEHMNGQSSSKQEPIVPRVIDPASYAVQGVYYSCGLIGSGVYSKPVITKKIQEYLYKEMKYKEENDEEAGTTACLLIHSCNKPQRVTACVETLVKYLDNIIQNPADEKFLTIKLSFKAYREKVAGVVGAEDFLVEAGFEKENALVGGFDEYEEEPVWRCTVPDIANLIALRDLLKSTKAIKPQLDRNVQVIESKNLQKRSELPDEFYTLSPEEIKREQRLKTERVEQELTLRTKAMRDRDELNEQRLYRYGVMRIRFPDLYVLQGTFGANETLENLFDFVRDNLLMEDLEFNLIDPLGENLRALESNSTLAAIKLTPATVINFHPVDPPQALLAGELSYLKPEVLQLIK